MVWLFAVVALLILTGTVLRFTLPTMQRSMLFPAPRAADRPPPQGFEAIWLEIPGSEGRIEAWYRPPPADAGSASPAVIFAHGNGELIDYWPEVAEQFHEWGLATLLLEYPGYGRSTGQPSESTIRAVAVRAYDWLRERPEIDDQPILGYGRSLGAAAVAQLARERRLAALIMESTFTSVTAMARRMGVPAALVSDPFDTLEVIESYRGSVLVLHGSRDEIVPVSHGEQLAETAGVELVTMPCGHNDCPRPWREIEDFLRAGGWIPR